MVIATIHASDSTNTLVSLDNNHDARSKLISSSSDSNSGTCCRRTSSDWQKTALLLPADELDLDYSSNDYDCHCACEEDEQALFLPSASSDVVDCLKQIPAIQETREELVAFEPRVFTEASTERILYVHQGEVAHAVASQECDVIMSDRATTCHILALHSTASSGATSEPMSSLTHIDGDHYEACVQDLVDAHKRHHGKNVFELQIHVVGGFADDEGQSSKISNWLVRVLARIADASSNTTMRLQTCVVSSMNDNGFQCPMGRGLAMELKTGRVFLAKATHAVMGPHMALRMARLWSAGTTKEHKLHVIHTATSDDMVIQPFAFAALPGMDKLMALPDQVLLEYTSTSPAVEEDDFCYSIRTTICFLQKVSCTKVFGRHCDRTLRFGRRSNTNDWKLM